ncbi:DUF547 domain-containing protein [Alcanivorax sp. N3-2A]|nr:DUF547 domain-containing protein [Alcanivorax sp. N3-2A]|tara:strand:+ start:5021 stop:5809 length:789 start_codon:yes stop_codon:yes gene_type:complete
MLKTLTFALLLLSSVAQAFDHGAWNQLLKAHVQWQRGGVASTVDYPGLRADREKLDGYLGRLSAVDQAHFNAFDEAEQLAFLINAYNAFTLKLILDQDTLPDSIRDIGSVFSGPWSQRFFTLLGKERTLDEVEHDLIRGNPALMDPRIHFAVNCASLGCPALRPEAYQGERLDSQLTDSTRRFLSDRSRNYFDAEQQALRVSRIFEWYNEDFVDAAGSLSAFLARYADALALPEAARRALDQGDLKIRFELYDWSLNRLEES